MPFGGFATLEEAARAYEITLRVERFIEPMPKPVNGPFQERLEFLRENAPVSASEEAVCEFLIAPILQEIWIAYSEFLMIWSHVHFGEGAPLKGYPDYFFSRRSPLGRVLDQPYVLFFEANGEVWYFAKLQGKALIQDPQVYTLTRLEELFAALHYLFSQAKCEALRTKAEVVP